jgi:hypothetical protein
MAMSARVRGVDWRHDARDARAEVVEETGIAACTPRACGGRASNLAIALDSLLGRATLDTVVRLRF